MGVWENERMIESGQ